MNTFRWKLAQKVKFWEIVPRWNGKELEKFITFDQPTTERCMSEIGNGRVIPSHSPRWRESCRQHKKFSKFEGKSHKISNYTIFCQFNHQKAPRKEQKTKKWIGEWVSANETENHKPSGKKKRERKQQQRQNSIKKSPRILLHSIQKKEKIILCVCVCAVHVSCQGFLLSISVAPSFARDPRSHASYSRVMHERERASLTFFHSSENRTISRDSRREWSELLLQTSIIWGRYYYYNLAGWRTAAFFHYPSNNEW